LRDFFGFIGAQALALLPMLVVVALLWRWRTARAWLTLRWQDFDSAYITALALGPIAVSLALSLLAMRPLRAMWGAPLWSFIGLFIVLLLKPALTTQRWRYLGRAWLVLLLLPIMYFVIAKSYGTSVTGNEQVVHFPGESLGRGINQQWFAATRQPLKYVVGDTWSAGNVSFYADDRPSVIFSHGDQRVSPWIDINDVHRSGAVLVWDIEEEGSAIPKKMEDRFPHAVLQPNITVTGKLSHRFGVAFLFPESLSHLH
jgi:hypothetical protein